MNEYMSKIHNYYSTIIW